LQATRVVDQPVVHAVLVVVGDLRTDPIEALREGERVDHRALLQFPLEVRDELEPYLGWALGRIGKH
jgi:hypothetical protein